MTPKVEWVRRDEAASSPIAGWKLEVDGDFAGHVWLDGSYSLGSLPMCLVHSGSQPLAAQALLRATGAATNPDETRRYKFGNEPRAVVGDKVKVPVDGWAWQATVLSVDADGYTVRPDKRLFRLKRRRGQL